jgi:outer membrane protein
MKTAMTLMLAAFLLALAPAGAAAATDIKLGVVDMNKIMQSTDAAKGIFDELEGKRKEFQAQIAQEEESLRNAEKEIVKKKDSLSKDEFDSKRKEFEDKVAGAQKLVQERKKTLDQAFNSSVQNLRVQAAKIVADIARDKGLAAVLTQDAVILAEPEMDITDQVVAQMNAKVKKIPVDWSAKKK